MIWFCISIPLQGDILFLTMSNDPIRAGEIVVFNVDVSGLYAIIQWLDCFSLQFVLNCFQDPVTRLSANLKIFFCLEVNTFYSSMLSCFFFGMGDQLPSVSRVLFLMEKIWPLSFLSMKQSLINCNNLDYFHWAKLRWFFFFSLSVMYVRSVEGHLFSNYLFDICLIVLFLSLSICTYIGYKWPLSAFLFPVCWYFLCMFCRDVQFPLFIE